MSTRESVDVAIVGGGIAGSGLASVLARAGVDVAVLERQHTYRDRVRGETMWPWGVAEAQQLGVYQTLLDAGGHIVPRFFSYDEMRDLAKPGRLDLENLLPGVPGSLNLAHATACRALAKLASSHGAAFYTGVKDVLIDKGRKPEVTFRGTEREESRLQCRLIVGADGRRSVVRRQAQIGLHRSASPHLIAGLLVDELHGLSMSTNFEARERDLMLMAFPQGNGVGRAYLCFPNEQRRRFAGPGRSKKFIKALRLECVPDELRWSSGRPAGPSATFSAEDTWTDTPFGEGVVLIGDAAGYNNPLIAQGLSMALRDARVLAELLLASDTWPADLLAQYGDERAGRLRKVRRIAQLLSWVNDGFQSDNAARRTDFRRRMRDIPVLPEVLGSISRGPDHFPPTALDPTLVSKLDPSLSSALER